MIIKNGTPEIIRTETLELLNKTASYQKFCFVFGCDVPPGTKIENIDALFNALNEYNEDQSNSIKDDFSSFFEDELLEREVLCWDNTLSVA